jgi:hypothetical protein
MGIADFTGTVLAAQGTNLRIAHGTILVILQVAFPAYNSNEKAYGNSHHPCSE